MGSRFVTSGATSSQEILHSLLSASNWQRESTTAKGVHEVLYVAETSSFDLLYNCTKKTASFKKVISNLNILEATFC